LLLDVKKLIQHKKYAAKAQKSKNLVCLLLHKTLCGDGNVKTGVATDLTF